MTSFGFLRSAAARSLGRFLADRRGTTAIEYGLIVTLIAVAIMSTVFAMGEGIKTTLYGTISNALASM
ncbi:MAG TPA: Flp family type IVb pilin [Xanthobacteraceae bacterium]|nr:Flp family type IVb pilin [Xanthobacteraceae bacterium]